jgi:hypothetical protein
VRSGGGLADSRIVLDSVAVEEKPAAPILDPSHTPERGHRDHGSVEVHDLHLMLIERAVRAECPVPAPDLLGFLFVHA